MLNKKFLKSIGVGIIVFALFACSKPTAVAETTIAETSPSIEMTASEEKVKDVAVSQELKDLYNEKVLEIKSAKNVRQLGGYTTKDGKKVKNGLLLRGGHLAKLSDEDAKIFKDKYNLKEIIDFRVAEEREPVLDRDIEGVNNNWVLVTTAEPIMNRLEKVSEDRDINMMATYLKYNGDIYYMYSRLVNDELAHEGYLKYFDILLKNDGATYFHCSSGKDRTGFAAVLTLSIFGVDKKTILDDYEASIACKADLMNKAIKDLREAGYSEEELQRVVSLVGVERKAMESALDEIDNKYGGMNAYLHNQIGLTDDEMQALRDKYLE